MNRDFQAHSAGREDDGEDVLLSPEEAVRQIEAGVPIEQVLAVLDVDACHFMPRVDDQGEEPIFTMKVPFYSGSYSGSLCITYEQLSEQTRAGHETIMVADISSKYPAGTSGLILLYPENSKGRNFGHDFMNLSKSPSVLVDNRYDSQISILGYDHGIKFANGEIIKAGELITTDPATGRIWNKELPMLKPDEYSVKLAEYLSKSDFSSCGVDIATHVHDEESLRKICEWDDLKDRDVAIGLYRSEERCREYLKGWIDDDFFSDLSKGVVPYSLNKIEHYGLTYSNNNYRLPDLHGLRDLLPEEFQKALDRGEEHDPDSPLFMLRKTLYRHQLDTALRHSAGYIDGTVRFIIPSVTNAEEVRILKKMVEEVTPSWIKDKIEFGVMMETEEALDNTREIARECDCLCYGMNDLSADMLKLERSILDHSGYMKDNGFEGRSPFETMVPPVIKKMARSMDIVREVEREQGRKIFTNACGHQVAGHDPSSIEKVLMMGVDQITVPPTEEHYNRAQFTIARFMAQQKLVCTPQITQEPEVG